MAKKYCCVNDADIYALEAIPEHEAKSKNLDLDYKEQTEKEIHSSNESSLAKIYLS